MSSSKLKFVKVKNKSYGKNLQGQKIFYEGKKPKTLKPDGSIKFGKNILEILKAKFKRFYWIISIKNDSIAQERGIVKFRTSQALLNKLNSELIERTRDIKNDLIRNKFSTVYPEYFTGTVSAVYVPGTISNLLDKSIVPRLSSEDKEAIINFLPDFISSESISSINLLKATTQIQSLRELATDLENSINNNHAESWWQKYIKSNILLIQQGYIKAIEKINIVVGNTKFPDFSLVTHDNYLDILEIKKPSTSLLKLDVSRDNYYWDIEMSKAIIQVENYIANISRNSDQIRNFLKDKYKIDLQVLRPRGIILAGDGRKFQNQKERDDFRLLSQSNKNIIILTYDELLSRLNNYIKVLEQHKI